MPPDEVVTPLIRDELKPLFNPAMDWPKFTQQRIAIFLFNMFRIKRGPSFFSLIRNVFYDGVS